MVTLSSCAPSHTVTAPRAATESTAACTELKAAVPQGPSAAPAVPTVPTGETYTVPGDCGEGPATAAIAMPGASNGGPVTPVAISHVTA